MSNYLLIITIIGLAAFGMSWMPGVSKRLQVSYAIIYVAAGALLYLAMNELPFPNPLWQEESTVRITELIVIISLMSTGLRIDQPFNFRSWAAPFRLVVITMILSIAVMALGGYTFLGFELASAVLLGAALAPTDPVLAADVQVGPPMEKIHDKVRFTLTAEAGLNDGMAFPFTWLAIALAVAANDGTSLVWRDWIFNDLLYKLAAGIAIGFALGRALAYLIFSLPSKKSNVVEIREGFVALSMTLIVYGVCELAGGYGFIAVFVTAITVRNYEINHDYHRDLHSFADQIERTLIAIVLLLFGGSLVNGILDAVTWRSVVFALACILIVRPACTYVALINTDFHWKEKLVVSFFGIKGIGSFFYLSFALSVAQFSKGSELWGTVALTVLFSLILHGLTASRVMQKISGEFTRPSGT